MKLQIAVTTMHQDGLELYKKMNLQTDAVIANQTDRNEIIEEIIDNHNVKIVSTTTRGVSRNRNIALAHLPQNTDIAIFADDDLIFNDGYADAVAREFDAHPEAEAIKFNLHDLSETRKISMRRIECFEKATRRNMSSSGVWGVAFKTKALIKFNLKFDERFGPGAEHTHGEDTIFLMNMIDKGVAFYRSPVDIAGINQTESSWFTGHNEMFFETSGMVIDDIYPVLSRLIVIRRAYNFSKRYACDMRFHDILKSYYRGIDQNKKQL